MSEEYRDDAPPTDSGDERLDMEHQQPEEPGADNEPSSHDGEEGQEVA
jgi:hypothetical protein